MSDINNLPDQFETFAQARKNGFLAAKEVKDSGKKMIGTFCCFTPSEIIIAAKAIPVGVCGVSEEPIPAAEKVLPRNLCPLIKSSYGHAITDTCPYFYFSDLLIGETTCDGKKKMYEELSKVKPMHVMQLPNRASGKYEFNLWKDEIILLKEVLEKELDITITEEDIKYILSINYRELYEKLNLDDKFTFKYSLVLKVIYEKTFEYLQHNGEIEF